MLGDTEIIALLGAIYSLPGVSFAAAMSQEERDKLTPDEPGEKT